MGSAGLICREELERTGDLPGSHSLKANDPVHGNVAKQTVSAGFFDLEKNTTEPRLAFRSATMALTYPAVEVTKFGDANHCSSNLVNANKSNA